MRPLLMYTDRSLNPDEPLPWNESALNQDLGLDILRAAMAGEDRFILNLVSKVLLSARCNDVAAVQYRQAAVRDSLDNPAAIRELYELAVEATEIARRHLYILRRSRPTSVLYEAIEAMREFLASLRRLGDVARARRAGFASASFRSLCDLIERELDAEYLARVEAHLNDLKFPHGLLLRAELGAGNLGSGYMLLESRQEERTWFQRLFDKGPPGLSFSLDPHDEAGQSILYELRNRGIHSAARALARAVDQIGAFFQSLRAELGLLVGSLNLYERLSALGHRICFPAPLPAEQRGSSCRGLYDPCLALQMGQRAIGNQLDAEGKDLLIITGANRGGKSSFLRSLGVAQVMLQCGLFVPAESFRGELCSSLATHFRREESAGQRRGKLDEELARLSEIVDHVAPGALLLCNESFSSTNEHEGSEIARQVITALLEKRIKVAFVTHLQVLARRFTASERALFLRADRRPDGTRSFQLVPGEPLGTSYGRDLYERIFGDSPRSGLMSPQSSQ